MLSLAKADFREKGRDGDTVFKTDSTGLASGSCLGLSTVFFKAAILELEGGDLLLNAGYAGAMAVLIQTTAMGVLASASANLMS